MNKNYNLVKARETDLNVTQEYFANKIPMDPTSYSYKESGKRKIWVGEANRIIEVLNEIAKEKNLNFRYTYDDIFLN